MSDYEANPQVKTPGTIRLYGNEYRLAQEQDGSPGKVQVAMSTVQPPKIVTSGDYGKDDQPTLSTYSVSDLRGGMGLRRYRPGHPEDLLRYYTGQNIDTLWPNAITLGPLMTSTGTLPHVGPPLGAGSGDTFGSYDGKLATAFEGELYQFSIATGLWGASLGALNNFPEKPPVIFNDRLFWAHSVPNSSTTGYTYLEGTIITTVADPDFAAFAVFDEKLWGIDADNFTLYSSTTGSAASWTTLGALTGIDIQPPAGFLDLTVYDDQHNNLTLWTHVPENLFIYDQVVDVWYPSRLELSAYAKRTGWNRTLAKFRGGLYVVRNDIEIMKLTMTGGELVIEDASPGFPGGLTTDYGGVIVNMMPSSGLLFAKILGGTPGAVNDDVGLLAYNGYGWHPLYFSTATATTTSGWEAALFVGQLGGAVSNVKNLVVLGTQESSTLKVVYFDLDNFATDPITSTVRTYASSGFLELPIFDGDFSSQQKTAIQCRVKTQGASANETVVVAYRIDGSTGAYTTLGTVSADTESVLKFGTNNVGVAFKSIQFKLTFARGGTTTLAPKIEYFACDFLRVPEALRAFLVTVDCRELVGGNTPRQQIDNLWTAIETNTLGTFAFRDDSATGSNNTRSFKVKATRPEGMESTGLEENGVYKLLLVSYGDN